MVNNFVLHKYRQTQSALEMQSTSLRLLKRKAALEWWIAKNNETCTK